MELSELTHKQQIALVALIEAVVMADGQVTDDEERGIGSITGAIGDDRYRDLLEEADEHFPDIDALKEFLTSVESQEARELIYGVVLDEAMASPSVDERKSGLLQWLAEAWAIDVRVEPEDNAD